LSLSYRKWREAEEDCIMWSLTLVSFTKFYLRDEVKDDDMGRECSKHGRDVKFIQNFA
jgi:hypothetical protein